MPAKSVMRLDVVGWKATTIAIVVCTAWILVSLIVGLTGPARLDRNWTFAYQCPNNNHTWGPNCTGSQMAYGEASPWMEVQAGNIDRTWHMMYQLYEKELQGIEGTVEAFIHVEAKNALNGQWTVVMANQTKHTQILCLGFRLECSKSLLLWEHNPKYNLYRVKVQFGVHSHNNMPKYIGDVGFESVTTPDSFAKLALGFKYTYVVLSILAAVLWLGYMIFYRKWSYSSWNWEQRYLTVLAVALILFNNPLFFLEITVHGWFFPFFSAFCKIIFIGLCLALWLTYIGRFKRAVIHESYLKARDSWRARRPVHYDAQQQQQQQGVVEHQQVSGDDHQQVPIDPEHSEGDHSDGSSVISGGSINSNPSSPTTGRRHHSSRRYPRQILEDEHEPLPPLEEPPSDSDSLFDGSSIPVIVIVSLYVVLSSGLFVWTSVRDRMTPIMGIGESTMGFQVLYYLSAAFYTILVIMLAVQLSFNVLGAREHKDLLWGRYVFFAGPTVILAFSLVLGMFTDMGPFSLNMMSVLCYSALFNCFVFFTMWAYWPVEGGFSSKDQSESRKLFDEARYPSHL